MILITEKAIYMYALILLLIWIFGNRSYKITVLRARCDGYFRIGGKLFAVIGLL